VPPAVVATARRALRGIRPEPVSWEYAVGGWDHATGWGSDREVAQVVARYRAKLPEFRAAIARPKPIGVPTTPARGTVPTVGDHNLILQFAYALALASRGRERVRVLDWGGGMGFLSLVAAELLPDLALDFHVKELPAICAAGRELMPHVVFFADERWVDECFDLVIASSSFQYVEDWGALLCGFARTVGSGGYLFLQQVPTALGVRSFNVRQYAYGGSFTSWVFGREELLDAAQSAGLVLLREFLDESRGTVGGAPADWMSRGYLLARRPLLRVSAPPR
jgi:putative methyltransferase (TIGR04325 family)